MVAGLFILVEGITLSTESMAMVVGSKVRENLPRYLGTCLLAPKLQSQSKEFSNKSYMRMSMR